MGGLPWPPSQLLASVDMGGKKLPLSDLTLRELRRVTSSLQNFSVQLYFVGVKID